MGTELWGARGTASGCCHGPGCWGQAIQFRDAVGAPGARSGGAAGRLRTWFWGAGGGHEAGFGDSGRLEQSSGVLQDLELGFGVLRGAWSRVLGCWRSMQSRSRVLCEDLEPGLGFQSGWGRALGCCEGLECWSVWFKECGWEAVVVWSRVLGCCRGTWSWALGCWGSTRPREVLVSQNRGDARIRFSAGHSAAPHQSIIPWLTAVQKPWIQILDLLSSLGPLPGARAS